MAALGFGEVIKGVTDGKVALLTGDTPGAYVDIPGIKSASMNIEAETDEQRGDDAIVAVTQEAKSLSVSVTSAYANAAALTVFTNGTVTTAGVTPNQTTLYKELSTSATRYVTLKVQGAGRESTGGAIILEALKCQVTSGPNFELADGSWVEPTLDLKGINRGGFLMQFTNYETAPAIT